MIRDARRGAVNTTRRERAADFLSAANEAAKAVGALHIAFVAFLAYVGAIIWSTTHADLLRDTPVQLPILQVKLSLSGFFQYVPWLIVLLHFNLLVQLYLLSRKLWLLDEAARNSGTPPHLKQRLFILPFAHYLVASERGAMIQALLGAAVGITIIAFPLFVLVYAQVTFLPFHDEAVTWWGRAAVWADAGLIVVLWPLVTSPTNRWRDWWTTSGHLRRALTLVRHRGKAVESPSLRVPSDTRGLRNTLLLLGAVACAVSMSLLALVPAGALRPLSVDEFRRAPDSTACDAEVSPGILDAMKVRPAQEDKLRTHCEWQPAYSFEHWLTQHLPGFLLTEQKRYAYPTGQTLRWTAALFDDDAAPFRRDLAIANERLLAEQTPAEVVAQLSPQTAHVPARMLERIIGISLRGRDLRRADLRGAVLIRADLRDSQLQDANLDGVKLHFADMRNAQLQRATGVRAHLSGADLAGARMQGVFFAYAQAKNADMRNSRLELATFTDAHMQGRDWTPPMRISPTSRVRARRVPIGWGRICAARICRGRTCAVRSSAEPACSTPD
jgi:hypothetical protein